jgi:hypothetical protein
MGIVINRIKYIIYSVDIRINDKTKESHTKLKLSNPHT